MTKPSYKIQYDPDNIVYAVKKESDGVVQIVLSNPTSQNRYYLTYLDDLKNYGMSILICDDCGDGVPNGSMWQYLDNAEQLLIDKYGSDQDKLAALREDRYVRAMEAKFPYENMKDAAPVIDATPQEIKDKYRHLPMRR
tara:strand:- start:9 stop:425 length:417 start_codon:yes stop_codon:yes gene_type:complete